jgi:UrcA family protein
MTSTVGVHRNTQGDGIVKRSNVLALVAALVMGSQAVHADELQVKINYADLDVARMEGAATLYARIHSAAERVCAPLDGRRLDENRRFRLCVGDAVAKAVSDVHQPRLDEYYQSKVSPRDRTSVTVAAR